MGPELPTQAAIIEKIEILTPLPRSGARRGRLSEACFHRFVPKCPLTIRSYTPKLHIYHTLACAEVWAPNPEYKPHHCGKSENLTFLPLSEALRGHLPKSFRPVFHLYIHPNIVKNTLKRHIYHQLKHVRVWDPNSSHKPR